MGISNGHRPLARFLLGTAQANEGNVRNFHSTFVRLVCTRHHYRDRGVSDYALGSAADAAQLYLTPLAGRAAKCRT